MSEHWSIILPILLFNLLLPNESNMKRRHAIKSGLLGLGALSAGTVRHNDKGQQAETDLDAILQQPVLRKELFPDPVIIESIELRRYKNNFICVVRSTDGAEGISVSNNMQMILHL